MTTPTTIAILPILTTPAAAIALGKLIAATLLSAPDAEGRIPSVHWWGENQDFTVEDIDLPDFVVVGRALPYDTARRGFVDNDDVLRAIASQGVGAQDTIASQSGDAGLDGIVGAGDVAAAHAAANP